MTTKFFTLPLFLIFLISQLSFSQSLELPEIGRAGFRGVQKMDESGYYIQFVESIENTRNVRVIVMNNELQVQADFKLNLKRDEKLEDLAYTDGKFLLVTATFSKKTRSYIVLDKAGVKINSKDFTELNARVFDQPARIIPLSNDFLVVSMFRDKKVGYVIDRYSSSLEAKYSQSFVPEKKKLYPVDFVVGDGVLYILEFYARDMSDNFEYHIAGVNLEDGKPLFNNYLKSADDKSFGYATFLRLGAKGEAISGGMYFNGDKEQEANSAGFFAAVVGKDGVLKYDHKTWKEFADQIKDKNTSTLWGGKTKTLMQDVIVNKDGTFTLIGENFRQGDESKAGGKSPFSVTMSTGSAPQREEWAVTVSDFILIDYDANGKFIGLRKMDKPNSVTIIHASTNPDNSPYVGQFQGLNLANMLNNYGYFPYRFTADVGAEKVFVYQLNYDRMHKEMLYFSRSSAVGLDTVSVDITNSYLKADQELNSKVVKKLGKLGALQEKMNKSNGESIQNEITLGRSDDPKNARSSQSGVVRVLPSNVNGKVLMYDFVPQLSGDENQKKNMLAQYYASKDAAVKAKLKIWYLNIPEKK